jgi:hypothetical protein
MLLHSFYKKETEGQEVKKAAKWNIKLDEKVIY